MALNKLAKPKPERPKASWNSKAQRKAWHTPRVVIIRFVDTSGGEVAGMPENSSGSIAS